jgi:hypothetical protein
MQLGSAKTLFFKVTGGNDVPSVVAAFLFHLKSKTMSSQKLIQSNKNRKPFKMDRYLIAANQPWEVNLVRALFYKVVKDEILHPDKQLVKSLCKKFNNSRQRIYFELRENMGYTQLKTRK